MKTRLTYAGAALATALVGTTLLAAPVSVKDAIAKMRVVQGKYPYTEVNDRAMNGIIAADRAIDAAWVEAAKDPAAFKVRCGEDVHEFRPFGLSPATREAVLRGNFLRRYGAEPVPVDRDAAFEEARRLCAFVDKRWPAGTHPDSWRTTLGILRRWTASPDALFAPEPFEG